MLDLYTIDGSCSNAVRDLLRHLDIDFADKPRSQHRAALEALHPTASVPVLDTAFGPLTESGAILLHLAETAGATALTGETPDQRARVLEMLFFLNSTVYYAFIPYFRPEKYAQTEQGQAEVKEMALTQIATAAQRLGAMASSDRHLVGDRLTVADFIGLVYLNWLARVSPAVLDQSGLAPLRAALMDQIGQAAG